MLRFFAFASSFLAFAASLPAAAGPVEATKPSQIVTVFGREASPACPGGPDGTQLVSELGNADGSTGSFAIPAKSVFVVQSFEYQLIGGDAGDAEAMNLIAVNPAFPPSATSNGAAAFAGGVVSANGVVVGSHTIPGGLIVKPPAALCFVARPALTPLIAVHGFFAKDK